MPGLQQARWLISKLSSSEFTDGGELPDDLKCTRHGGDSESPPLEWSGAPEGTGAHTYTITVYAVDNSLDALPENDDPSIVWDDVMAALNSHVLNAASISYTD